MPVTEKEIRKIRDTLTGQISVFQSAMEACRAEGSDENREAERNAKEKLDLTFWNLIFSRIEQIVAASPGDVLEFTPEDYLLFNAGWVDDALFPKNLLNLDDSFSSAEHQIMYLTEWLAKEDALHLEVAVRQKIGESIEHIKGEIARKDDIIVSLDAWRKEQMSEIGVANEKEFLRHVSVLQKACLATYKLEKLRRKRSLDKDEVTALAASLAEQSRLDASVTQALQDAPEEARTRFPQINQKIIGLDREVSDCRDQQSHLEEIAALALERYEQRRAERMLHLEEKLKEIKEDIRFCSKWGRSEYLAVLLSGRALNHKALIIETIKVIEDFDPKVFNNKMVERRGKPAIVLTPGTGNGSYDFRSNTIIIPVTSPHSVLESLAYAFALYRKDIDQECNESKTWESFFSDDVWRGIKDRERPKHLRSRMIEFVRCYTDWMTKESKGLMVLDLEIRKWFEENIAPEKRGLIVPWELRHVKVAEREKLLGHYMQSPAPQAAYMAGVLLFKMGSFEQSDRQFERAVELSPESPEPHWARAILMMLDERDMKRFDGGYIRGMRLKDRLTIAKDEFQKFTKIGEQSWWTLKAQEHIRRLSEQLAQLGRR